MSVYGKVTKAAVSTISAVSAISVDSAVSVEGMLLAMYLGTHHVDLIYLKQLFNVEVPIFL